MSGYIATRRAKFNGISGPVNIPYGTKLDLVGRFICQGGKAICSTKSKEARAHFAPDGDGKGLERGALIAAIKATLEQQDADHQKRWNKIWGSLMCKRYQDTRHQDFWIWNQAFYEAPVEDLRAIAAMIGSKVS